MKNVEILLTIAEAVDTAIKRLLHQHLQAVWESVYGHTIYIKRNENGKSFSIYIYNFVATAEPEIRSEHPPQTCSYEKERSLITRAHRLARNTIFPEVAEGTTHVIGATLQRANCIEKSMQEFAEGESPTTLLDFEFEWHQTWDDKACMYMLRHTNQAHTFLPKAEAFVYGLDSDMFLTIHKFIRTNILPYAANSTTDGTNNQI